MSNTEFMKEQRERQAAHMLMVDYVKNNADLIAEVLEPIVATWFEISYASLKDSMGVVSQVFAGIALELIEHNSGLDPEDVENMVLPVGAKTMNNTIEQLSKLVNAVQPLFVLFIDKEIKDPALEMARQAFYKYEAQM